MTSTASFSINDFMASMSANGLAWADRFEVSITTPKCLTGSSYDVSKLASIRADHVSFPPLTINSKRLQIFGASEPRPQSLDYGGENGLQIAFLLDKDMTIKSMFDYWLQSIVDVDNALVAYQSQYVTTLTIKQLDKNNNVTYSVEIDDTYPFATMSIDLDNASGNLPTRLMVGFAYRKWKNLGLPAFGQNASQSARITDVTVTKMAQNNSTSPADNTTHSS
jgi:hypothetical protein